MKSRLNCFIIAATISLCAASQGWASIAYSDATGLVQQNFGNVLGMDFDVNAVQIRITALGVFDNGLLGNLDGVVGGGTDVAIFDRTSGLQFGPSVHFDSTSPGTQIAGDAFKSVDFFLSPGFQGSIVAYNVFNGNSAGANTLDNGGGLISFVGSSRFNFAGALAYPVNGDLNVNKYNAGTFQFTSQVPEPSTLMLIGLGLAGLWASFRHRRE